MPAQPAPTPFCEASACPWASLIAGMDSAVTAGAAPGAVLGVSVGGVRHFHSSGRTGIDQPARPGPSTVYDLASLTKVVALTTLVMQAVDEGKLDLDRPVADYLPAFAQNGKAAITTRLLLAHASGLPAHRPLWREAPDREAALDLVLATPLDTTPGSRMVYSDLGAITVGLVVERVLGGDLASLARSRIFDPLGLTSTRYRPPKSWLPRVAPTERDPWRGRIVHGEVHDENAAFLGGVSGHAGLFGSVTDLIGFGEWLLRRYRNESRPGDPSLSASVVREFTHQQQIVPGSSRALGWDTPSPNSSAGTRLDPSSFGHTGFTGTSIWIDPTRELVIVLLTNRVHPSRENARIAPFRQMVAERVVEALESRGSIR
ncbi:MAG: serine hydrolase domain-containing protein [Gemmatimonadales bacterium]